MPLFSFEDALCLWQGSGARGEGEGGSKKLLKSKTDEEVPKGLQFSISSIFFFFSKNVKKK